MVIQPWKSAVVDYVRDRMNGVPVVPVMFDHRFEEWPGSVYSAAAAFSPVNLVLLPDSYLEAGSLTPWQTDDGRPLLAVFHGLLEQTSAAFGVLPVTGTRELTHLGAVHVDAAGVITDFQDKPDTGLNRYNAFWGCYGFRDTVGKQLYHYLIDSVHHQAGAITSEPFHPVSAIWLHRYFDLGTWNAVNRFRSDVHRAPSGKKGFIEPLN